MKVILTQTQPTSRYGDKTYAGPAIYELSLEFPDTGIGPDKHDTLTEFIKHLQCIADKRNQSILRGLEAVIISVPVEGVTCVVRQAKGEF